MIQLIPAIDLIDGKCVRLTQGDYSQKKVYEDDPLDAARRFEDAGLTRLHLVDLDGAKAGRVVNYKTIERVAARTSLQIDFGGGIAGEDDVRIAFECGVDLINLGSIAIKNQALSLEWLARYGADRVILSADARKEKVAISGWLDQTDVLLVDHIRVFQAAGLKYVTCTDIERDGMLQGPSIDLYAKLLDSCEGVQLIASGGVASMADVEELNRRGIYGVIIGRALYEGRIQLSELKSFQGT